MYQTAYCAIAVIGLVATLGLFDAKFDRNFYVHFTNISNYFCIGIMTAELVQTVRRKGNGFTTVSPSLKFTGVLAILLTLLLYNGMFAGTKPMSENLSVDSVLFHVLLPILFVADWFLFYERKKTKWYQPLYAVIFLVCYVLFVYLRVWLMGGTGDVVYPYFFLDATQLGWNGVLKWMGILVTAYVAAGYLLCFLDHVMKSPSES